MNKVLDIKKINKIILDVSFKRKLSHLSSCLQAAPIIKHIYETKKRDEKFILSSGHAGLALYGVNELTYTSPTAEEAFKHHGVHPDRCESCHLDCSTGSLGQGLSIALGMALADRSKAVYCLISDGECAEGSIWEALATKTHLRLDNLRVFANLNGYGAYGEIDRNDLSEKLHLFDPEITIIYSEPLPLEWLRGLPAHYNSMDAKRYQESLELLT